MKLFSENILSSWKNSCESSVVFQESDLASVIVGLIQVVFTGVAALIMDKAGRKILLIISGISNIKLKILNKCIFFLLI